MLNASEGSELLNVGPLPRLTAAGDWQIALAHARRAHMVLWITRGQGRLLLNGGQTGFGSHTAIVIPARSLFALELGRQTIGQVLQFSETLTTTLPSRPVTMRISDMQEQARITALMDAAFREQQLGDAFSSTSLRSYAELIGVAITRQQLNHAPKTKQTAAQRLSQAFCNQIAEDCACRFNMAAHAEALNVTPTHLTRVCKAQTGRTAANLLNESQLHAARSALLNDDRPIRDIAQSLSFGSPAYFTRFIAQHTGQTPSQLRKKALSLSGI